MRSNDTRVYFRSYEDAVRFANEAAPKFKTSIGYERNGSGGAAVPPQNLSTEDLAEFKELWKKFVVSVSQNKFEVTAFSATLLALISSNAKELGMETSSAVIEALHLANPQTSQMSDEQLSDYLTNLTPEQLEGVVNATKGKYHELKFVEHENNNFDDWHAEIISDPNHVGSDIVLTNLKTGDVTEIQLKATDSIGYVSEHIERYADIPVLVTSEVASKLGDSVQSSGMSNEDLTQEVIESLQHASSESLTSTMGDLVTDGVIGAGIYSVVGSAETLSDKGYGPINEPDIRSKFFKLGLRGAAMLILGPIFI